MRGLRDLGEGEEKIESARERARLRKRAVRTLLLAAATSLVLTSLAFLVK